MTSSSPSCRAPLRGGLLGSLLCFASHPPGGLALLAWIGPIAWLWLVLLPAWGDARRPYLTLWLAGTLYWMLTIHWIRLPHPAMYATWILLPLYLGLYLPAAIGLMRVGVQRAGLPLWGVAPIVWTGLEAVRARAATGFSMGSLAHSQVGSPWVLQLADLGGESLVTFAMYLVSSLLTLGLYRARTAAPAAAAPSPPESEFPPSATPADRTACAWRGPVRWAPLWASGVILVGWFAYGQHQITRFSGGRAGPVVGLIQGDSLADWKGSTAKDLEIMRAHRRLSLAASAAARDRDGTPPDVIVWPETMFRQPLVTADLAHDSLADAIGAETLAAARADLATLASETGSALVVGIDRFAARLEPTPEGDVLTYDLYNSSVGVTRDGRMVGYYDKMHLLPLGEYVPLVDWLPLLRRLTPITGLAQFGAGPNALELGGVTYAPNICYESAVGHLIRSQVAQLAGAGQRPDILVNLTNDAWYWGSSELDMHLACSVLRAVETRTPLLVAANRGLSAHIDAAGRVLQVTRRDEAAYLLADVQLVPRELFPAAGTTRYVAWGDWLAWSCVAACGGLVVVGWIRRSGSDTLQRR